MEGQTHGKQGGGVRVHKVDDDGVQTDLRDGLRSKNSITPYYACFLRCSVFIYLFCVPSCMCVPRLKYIFGPDRMTVKIRAGHAGQPRRTQANTVREALKKKNTLRLPFVACAC